MKYLSAKALRDVIAASMIGIIGGLLITTIAYYQQHKEGGVFQTLLAVTDSFYTVGEAYAGEDGAALLSDLRNYDIETGVLEAMESVEDKTADSVVEAMAQSLLDRNGKTALADGQAGNKAGVLLSGGGDSDVLVMEDNDDNTDEDTLYSGILRFHVRANSDSDEDQKLKMAVKEDVMALLEPLLSECKSVAESKNVIVSNLQNIYQASVNTVTEQGYDYEIKVYVTEEKFPAKTYGDLTFPEGKYQALRIDIGKAQGQNWWCVMYPPLCFIDESTVVVPEEAKEMLEENLTPQEYADLFANSQMKAESWIYNWLVEKNLLRPKNANFPEK
ncbi:MAG: stage II sporulation protein R [Clostridium sp.]|nr:stage II sporulation protein R [Clostridium sp.]